ncbi:MAG: Zn-dependent exopeptidase M28 [Treponema sp.]|jgi:hypothetical protein|nr:Zn-dependent exopeptidase M28 [Treponema sp.]
MHELFHRAPYSRFMEFIAPDADRRGMLCSMLEHLGLDFTEIALGESRHIAVFPRGKPAARTGEGFPQSVSVIFAAHYDRAEGSPGANDNSAAVFMLLETALRIKESAGAVSGGAGIIFTDKEELKTGEALEEQGSYALALYLKERGQDTNVFIFDACGSGDTLIVSTTAETLLRRRGGGAALLWQTGKLRTKALEAARAARIERVLLLATPFSDDAGFLKAGLGAQTITVLPASEAAAFSALVRRQPETSDALLSSAAAGPLDRRRIPETWRSLNGPGDSRLRLTPEHWKHVVAFAGALGET